MTCSSQSQCSCSNRCLVKNATPPPADANIGKRAEYTFLCPPHGIIERLLTNGLLLFLSWAVPWSMLGEACSPGSNIFSLIITIDICVLAGVGVSLIQIPSLPPLPPLLGMIMGGFCMRNIPVINVAKDIDSEWSSALRSVALTLILIKAGLELDATALKRMKGACVRLTAIPCLVETMTCGVTCKIILGFPWEWGFLLGFVLAAVSPAVIVPSLLTLQDQGYGVGQGVPTLVIAASSFDDVLAISGFSVVLGIIFSTVSHTEDIILNANGTSNASLSTVSPEANEQMAGELVWTIFRGPVEMLIGIVVGIVIGIGLWYLPSSNIAQTTRDRLLSIISLGLLAVFGSRRAGFPGAGALAAIVLAFVAAIKWNEEKEKVSQHVGLLWDIFEPVMFGLIGAEIALDELDSAALGLGVAVLFMGLVMRSVACFLAVSWSGFTTKEKFFICLAWLPKATVQAAIGSVALDTARSVSAGPEILNLAHQILTIAVLSIIITAPLGAAAIGLSGPKLLQKAASATHLGKEQRETLNLEAAEEIEHEAEPLNKSEITL